MFNHEIPLLVGCSARSGCAMLPNFDPRFDPYQQYTLTLYCRYLRWGSL